MKKVFLFAAIILLALPLMNGCKDHNEPDGKDEGEVIYDPSNPSEGIGTPTWFDYWTEGDEAKPEDIKSGDLVGFWQLRVYTMKVDSENKPSSPYDTESDNYGTGPESFYYEILKDGTDTLLYTIDHQSGSAEGLKRFDKFPGKWYVVENKLYINQQRWPGGMRDSDEPTEFTIMVLEEDRMVLTTKGNNEGETFYYVYVRTKKPAEPKTKKLSEVLSANKWMITQNEELLIGYIDPDPADPSDGKYDTLELKEDHWKGYQLGFTMDATDSVLTVYSPGGSVYEEYTFSMKGDDVEFLNFNLTAKGESTIFADYFDLEWIDFKNYLRGKLWSWESVPMPESEEKYSEMDRGRGFTISLVK